MRAETCCCYLIGSLYLTPQDRQLLPEMGLGSHEDFDHEQSSCVGLGVLHNIYPQSRDGQQSYQ